MANRTFSNAGHFYAPHTFPVLLDCNFTVDDSNANGISGLKGPGIQAVYMHTATTPSAGNPNPAAGYCIVQLQDAYYKDFIGFSGQVTPLSGSSILMASAGVTAGVTYVITVVGTTTQANWELAGVPAGVTAAVGLAFVATTTATRAGTGAVQVPHANGTGIDSVESVGVGALGLSPTGNQRGYPYLIFRFMGPTGAGDTTPIAVAPRALSVISFKLYLGNSSVVVQGE